jgi:hypothetical protein
MAITLSRGEQWEKGKWWGKQGSVWFACPACGGVGKLDEHQVSPTGSVSPAVQCAYDGCAFYEYVLLGGW